MIATDDLIAALAANLTPVRRLRPPILRAAGFLLLAGLILAMIAMARGLRPDLDIKLVDLSFDLSFTGSILTGVLAAIAAFFISLPGRSQRWLLLPLPAIVLWLSSIGYQCLTRWVAIGPEGISLGETAACFATLVLTSVPLSLALGLMLRHAARFNPAPVILAGSLAVAGITSTGLTLFHSLDASVMILMFNLGTALLFLLCGGIVDLMAASRAGQLG
jgi:hypothetical protein